MLRFKFHKNRAINEEFDFWWVKGGEVLRLKKNIKASYKMVVPLFTESFSTPAQLKGLKIEGSDLSFFFFFGGGGGGSSPNPQRKFQHSCSITKFLKVGRKIKHSRSNICDFQIAIKTSIIKNFDTRILQTSVCVY